jgi:hypothetical protein
LGPFNVEGRYDYGKSASCQQARGWLLRRTPTITAPTTLPRDHARIGVPVTLATLAIVWLWLA